MKREIKQALLEFLKFLAYFYFMLWLTLYQVINGTSVWKAILTSIGIWMGILILIPTIITIVTHLYAYYKSKKGEK